MSEYIDRETAVKRFQEIKQSGVSFEDAIYLDGVMAVIENIPAAEVMPVIHAKWEIIPLNMDPLCSSYLRNLRKKCTACEYAMPAEYPNYNICPCCGAVMDGEQNVDA